jgi:Ca2+-binding RTX toxin-like protein
LSGTRVLAAPQVDGVQAVVDVSGTQIELRVNDAVFASVPVQNSEALLIRGTPGPDTVSILGIPASLSGKTTVKGGAGDDRLVADGLRQAIRLEGGGGHDVLTGGNRRDTLAGGLGNDLLSGNHGNDVLLGSRGWDTLNGGFGNDILKGQASADTLTGGPGDDRLIGNGSRDVVTEAGDVDFQVTRRWLYGLGNDRLTSIEEVQLTGGDGSNRIDASAFPYDVVLSGLGGNDTLLGGAGADTISAGDGADVVSGGPGDNELFGGSGIDIVSDFVSGLVVLMTTEITQGDGAASWRIPDGDIERADFTGSAQADEIDASRFSGPVTLLGGNGNDTLTGTSFDDQLSGDSGNDVVSGNRGNDQLAGGAGDDSINGGDGADTLDGHGGRDTLQGDFGADVLNGGADSDYVDGGRGDDRVAGDAGDDTVRGGGGVDEVSGGDGIDRLSEFLSGRYDLKPDGISPHEGFFGNVVSIANRDIEEAELIGGTGNDWLDAETFGHPVTLLGNKETTL